MLKLKDDFQIIRPTIFLSVPRLYNRLVQVIKQKFEAEKGMKKWLINRGVNSKLGWVE
jgi:long-chain acyl-CoA synthetase